MRSIWNEIPMLRIAFALASGIILHLMLRSNIAWSEVSLWACVSVSVLFLILACIPHNLIAAKHLKRWQIVLGAGTHIILITSGLLLARFHSIENHPAYFGKVLRQKSIIRVMINHPPQVRNKTVRTEGKVLGIYNGDRQFRHAVGKIQLLFYNDSLSKGLKYGDIILIRRVIKEIETPRNPASFDLRRYRSYHHIFHEVFLFNQDWVIAEREAGNFLFDKIFRLRQFFLHIIEQHIHDPDDFAVASALLLGYRDFMSHDLISAYSTSGLIHILCVSGLHVGIIFMMFNFILSWMDNRGTSWIISKSVIIILFIWFYAALTGLSPSVLRAAVMFSILQIGKSFYRHTNTYNTLAGSAVILMIFSPFIITEIGFQLSYLAVAGIIYFHPRIASILPIDIAEIPQYRRQNKFINKLYCFVRYDLKWFGVKLLDSIWQIAVVSISAQIATAPLAMYYFHQFPNLFLVANVVVIPAISLIIYSGVALFFFHPFNHLASACAGIFNLLLHKLNGFVDIFQQVPYAVTEGISISFAEMLLIYSSLFLILLGIEFKRGRFLFYSLGVIVAITTLSSYDKIQHGKMKQLIVYAPGSEKAIAFISKGRLQYDFSEQLLFNNSAMAFHIKPHWWKLGVRRHNQNFVPQTKNELGTLYLFEGKKILVVESDLHRLAHKGKTLLTVDLVILSGNRKISVTELRQLVKFNSIVFDASNKPWKVKKWQQECLEAGITCYDVNAEGAFQYYVGD